MAKMTKAEATRLLKQAQDGLASADQAIRKIVEGEAWTLLGHPAFLSPWNAEFGGDKATMRSNSHDDLMVTRTMDPNADWEEGVTVHLTSEDLEILTLDAVNHPSHYASGSIEVIDFIEDKELGFHLGNVTKYVARAGKKDPAKEIEDCLKARWYLDRHIENLRSSRAVSSEAV
jgi:hypothetical protein